jgi:hypothetical protein
MVSILNGDTMSKQNIPVAIPHRQIDQPAGQINSLTTYQQQQYQQYMHQQQIQQLQQQIQQQIQQQQIQQQHILQPNQGQQIQQQQIQQQHMLQPYQGQHVALYPRIDIPIPDSYTADDLMDLQPPTFEDITPPGSDFDTSTIETRPVNQSSHDNMLREVSFHIMYI